MSPPVIVKRPRALKRLLTTLGAALTQRPQRTLALPVCGVVVGVLAAGVGVFHRAPPRDSTVPPGYVALVNGKGILLSDFMLQTATESEKPFEQTTPAERGRVLREMINEELLVQRALVLDLPETTTEVRGVMVDAVNAQVSAGLLAAQPSVAELEDYYSQHLDKYTTDGTMTAHDLLLGIGGYSNADQSTAQAMADASEAVYQLRAGASIDYIKEHFGFADSGRLDNSEQLDFAARLHLGDRLYLVAATLGNGEVSDPVLDTDGIHVLVMDKRVPPHVASFEVARAKIYTDYRTAQSRRAAQENLAALRSQARIELAPGETQ